MTHTDFAASQHSLEEYQTQRKHLLKLIENKNEIVVIIYS